jgi:hypothetical protein
MATTEPKVVKTWDELPPIVFDQGEAFSTRVLERQHRNMFDALTKISATQGCECDSYNGHRCLMCKVRSIAMGGLGV